MVIPTFLFGRLFRRDRALTVALGVGFVFSILMLASLDTFGGWAILYAVPAALVTASIVVRLDEGAPRVRRLAAVAAVATYAWTPIALFVLVFLAYSFA
jgi:hypothetical protein